MKKPRLTDEEAAILMKAAHGIRPVSEIDPDVGDTTLKHHEVDEHGEWREDLWLFGYVTWGGPAYITDRGREFLDEWLQSKPKT